MDAALKDAKRSVALASSQERVLEEAIARQVLGQVTLALGQWAQAERELRASQEILERLSSRYRLGQTLHHLARLYRVQGRGVEAGAALKAAIALLQALGAQLDLAQAEALRDEQTKEARDASL